MNRVKDPLTNEVQFFTPYVYAVLNSLYLHFHLSI